MKTFSLAWFCGLTLAANAANHQTLIAFDDHSLHNYGEPAPNGYAGLQGDEFGFLDPRDSVEPHSRIRVLTEHKVDKILDQLHEVDFEQLSLSFNLNPAVPNPLLLDGVLFSDPFQLNTGFCTSPTCEPDPDNSSGGNIVLFLSWGATLTFSERPETVVLDVQGIGDNSFSLLVSDGRNGTRSVSGQSVPFGASLFGVSSPFGISTIQIQRVSQAGEPFVLARVLFSTIKPNTDETRTATGTPGG